MDSWLFHSTNASKMLLRHSITLTLHTFKWNLLRSSQLLAFFHFILFSCFFLLCHPLNTSLAKRNGSWRYGYHKCPCFNWKYVCTSGDKRADGKRVKVEARIAPPVCQHHHLSSVIIFYYGADMSVLTPVY